MDTKVDSSYGVLVGDSMRTLFWEDTWLGETLLASQYLTLFNIDRTKEVTVASQVPLNIRFNVALTRDT
jgi:hypothetical protein